MAIDPTARVADGARIGEGVEIGPYCLVGPQVELKSGVRLIGHVNVTGVTSIGEDSIVYPVSYTHLDVYKRQMSTSRSNRPATFRSWAAIRPPTASWARYRFPSATCLEPASTPKLQPRSANISAVSYTHLDVYKRQRWCTEWSNSATAQWSPSSVRRTCVSRSPIVWRCV